MHVQPPVGPCALQELRLPWWSSPHRPSLGHQCATSPSSGGHHFSLADTGHQLCAPRLETAFIARMSLLTSPLATNQWNTHFMAPCPLRWGSPVITNPFCSPRTEGCIVMKQTRERMGNGHFHEGETKAQKCKKKKKISRSLNKSSSAAGVEDGPQKAFPGGDLPATEAQLPTSLRQGPQAPSREQREPGSRE